MAPSEADAAVTRRSGPRSAPGAGGPGDAELRLRTLEHLVGVRSSKPSFYAAWRDNTARLDRTIETLERISTALCAAPDGPGALCDAVLEAAAHHFDAPWAALIFCGGSHDLQPSHVVRRVEGRILCEDPEPMLRIIATRALEAEGPVAVIEWAEERIHSPAGGTGAIAAHMPVRGVLAGVLAVGLTPKTTLASTDLSILVTLANHAGVALHNARLFQESERLRLRWESVSRLAERRAAELERRTDELEGIRLRLEDAGRRELLSQERNRIARELHDSVAQQLLTIGMILEWCRRHESTSSAVLERVSSAKALARSAVDEIRCVIFELARDGHVDLRQELHRVVEDVVVGTRLQVGLRTYGHPQPVSGATQHALVQIAREALFNVVRHANAQRAWLTLRWCPDAVRLVVADNGDGDPQSLQSRLDDPTQPGRHFGLAGISERVRELAGVVTFCRRRGGGVSLTVQVPLGGAGALRRSP